MGLREITYVLDYNTWFPCLGSKSVSPVYEEKYKLVHRGVTIFKGKNTLKDDAILTELADFGARFEITPKF